jgi:integrase
MEGSMAVRQRGTYKDGKPRWICQWVDLDGVDHIKTFKTKGAAKTYEEETGVSKRAGTHVPDSRSETVAAAADAWIAAVTAGRSGGHRGPAEASTLRQYRYHLDRYILPALGRVKLSKLTKAHVIRFREELLKTVSEKTEEKMSRPLAKKVLTSLKGILNEAIHRQVLAVNPAAGITVGGDRGKKKITIPTKADIGAILRALDDLAATPAWRRRRALISTAIYTGMRASEIRGLPWSSVDPKAGTIEVTQRADENGNIGEPKSKSGHRTIHIPPELVAVLKEWKMACPAGSTLVFPVGEDRPESLANIFNRTWVPLLEAAKVKQFNFHSLRHFHAAMLIDAGANPKEVQVELGHAGIQITFDLYGSLFHDDDADRGRRERAARMASELR